MLSDDSAETILTALHRPIEIVNIASVVLAVVGITLVLSITFYTIFNFVRSKLGSEKPQKVSCKLICVLASIQLLRVPVFLSIKNTLDGFCERERYTKFCQQ